MSTTADLFTLPKNATHDEAEVHIRAARDRLLRRVQAGQISLTPDELAEYLALADRTLRLIEQDRHGAANLELVFPIVEGTDHP
jgi:hypothetical protein